MGAKYTTLEIVDALICKVQNNINGAIGVTPEEFDMLLYRIRLPCNTLSAYSNIVFLLNRAMEYLSSDLTGVASDKINEFFEGMLKWICNTICSFLGLSNEPIVAILSVFPSTLELLEKLETVSSRYDGMREKMDSVAWLRSNITFFQQSKMEAQAPQENFYPA